MLEGVLGRAGECEMRRGIGVLHFVRRTPLPPRRNVWHARQPKLLYFGPLVSQHCGLSRFLVAFDLHERLRGEEEEVHEGLNLLCIRI